MKLCDVCHLAFPDANVACPEHGETLKPDPLVGTDLSSFRITGWLGEGGMGLLYKAEHTGIGRKAAVKVIKSEFVTDETAAGRFAQEARTVAKIGHPHLIDIFDIGTTPDGRMYYVMELLEGRPLTNWMHDGRKPFSDFAPILIEALQALEAAHAVGVVHRDLKPDNLFLIERAGEPPFVKVLDFGIAKVLGTDEDVQTKLTRAGSIVGTPQYMSPEQVEGKKIDHRTDVYAVGVMIYELTTGKLPFTSDTLGGMLKAHLLDDPPLFETTKDSIAEGTPLDLEAVVFKSMAKEPDQRYQGMRELREDLESVLMGQAPLALDWWADVGPVMRFRQLGIPIPQPGDPPPPSPVAEQPPPPPPPKSRMPLVIAGLSLVTLVPVVLLAWIKLAPKPPPPPPPPPIVVVEAPKKPPFDPAQAEGRARAQIQAALKDGDPSVRHQTLELIGELHDPAFAADVQPLLADASPEVQAVAAKALGLLGARSVLPALQAASGKDAALDVALAQAELRLGDGQEKKKAIESLKKLSKSVPDAARLQLMLVLADAGQKDARQLLEKVQQTPGIPEGARLAIAGNLARNGDAAARETLAKVLDTATDRTLLAAAESLLRSGDARARPLLTKLAGDEKSPLRLPAMRLLAGAGEPVDGASLHPVISDAARPPQDRLTAARTLGAVGDPAALETLAAWLEDPTPLIRLASAGAIVEIRRAQPRVLLDGATAWSVAALADASAEVRADGAEALAVAPAAIAVPLLAKALHDPDVEVRRAAATSLASDGPAAVAPLTEALADAKPEIRLAALRSLATVDGKAAAPAIEKLLAKAQKEEKLLAAAALVTFGDKTRAPLLADAFKTSDAALRRLAVEKSALDGDAFAKVSSLAVKDKAPPVRLEVGLQQAARGDKAADDVLQEALKKPGAGAVQAAAALAHLAIAPATPPPLSASVELTDAGQRALVAAAARALPIHDALAVLTRAAADPEVEVRRAAASSLTTLAKDPAAARALRALVADSDPVVRADAWFALGAAATEAVPEHAADTPASDAALPSVSDGGTVGLDAAAHASTLDASPGRPSDGGASPR